MRRLLLSECWLAIALIVLLVEGKASGSIQSIPTTGVIAQLLGGGTAPATDAYLDNDTNNDVGPGVSATLANLKQKFGFSSWNLLAKSDESPFPFQFANHSNIETKSGVLTLQGAFTPLDGPFAITIKGGTGYVAFFFNSLVQDVVALEFNLSLTGLLNDGGKIPDLSHASLFVPVGLPPDPEPTVPEPASLMVFSLLAMAGGAGYWRSKQAASAAA